MSGRDDKDLVGGGLLIAMGAFVAYYASSHYQMGEFSRMGPGMFPTLVGGAMCVVGSLIAGPALVRPASERQEIEWRSLVTVIGSMVAFALTVTTFGMIAAIVLLTFCAAYADGRLSLPQISLLAAVLCWIAFLIFRVFLNSPFAMVRWPF